MLAVDVVVDPLPVDTLQISQSDVWRAFLWLWERAKLFLRLRARKKRVLKQRSAILFLLSHRGGAYVRLTWKRRTNLGFPGFSRMSAAAWRPRREGLSDGLSHSVDSQQTTLRSCDGRQP